MVCSKCQQSFPNVSERVNCTQCSAEYHVACCRVRTAAKLKKMTESGTAWRCEDCTRETASVSSKSDLEDNTVMELLKSLQKQLSESSRENLSNFTALQQPMATMQTSLDSVRLKLVAIEEENVQLRKQCQMLGEENKKLSKDCVSLQYSVVELEQHSKLQNLEIRGIPVTAGEDIYVVLSKVARALKLDYNPRDVSIAHRLTAPRNKSFPPAIIVQFVCRTVRAEWLAAARATRIKTTDLLPSFTPASVFINEHLSRHNRELLMRAKSAVRRGDLAYAWTKEGKVLVRKTADSKAIRLYWTLNEIIDDTPPGDDKAGPPGAPASSAH